MLAYAAGHCGVLAVAGASGPRLARYASWSERGAQALRRGVRCLGASRGALPGLRGAIGHGPVRRIRRPSSDDMAEDHDKPGRRHRAAARASDHLAAGRLRGGARSSGHPAGQDVVVEATARPSHRPRRSAQGLRRDHQPLQPRLSDVHPPRTGRNRSATCRSNGSSGWSTGLPSRRREP